MAMNINGVSPNPAYLKNIYTEQNANRPEAVSADRENIAALREERDRLTISAEARRLSQANQAVLTSNERSVDQEREIYRPGQEQLILRGEDSLVERPGPDNNEVQSMPVSDREEGLNRMDQQNRLADEQVAAAEPSADFPREAPAAGENNNASVDAQDLTTGAGNVNNVNSSSVVQAYASAANMTQASLTVNYKV